MQFKVEFDEKTIRKRFDAIPQKIIKPAVNTALNKAGDQGKTAGIKDAAEKLRIKQKLLKDKKRLKITRSNFSRLTYSVRTSRRTITYYSLGTRAKAEQFSGFQTRKRKGVRVGAGKSSRFLKGAFVRQTRRGHTQIFRRDDENKLEVQRLFIAKDVEAAMNTAWRKVARPNYQRELYKQFDQRIRRLNQQLKR